MQEAEYYFDGAGKVFYPVSNEQAYIEAGMWPETGVKVSADVYYIYGGTPPEGKVLSADKKVTRYGLMPLSQLKKNLYRLLNTSASASSN
ncbi:hypothetical protein [Citrobacter freundii]